MLVTLWYHYATYGVSLPVLIPLHELHKLICVRLFTPYLYLFINF